MDFYGPTHFHPRQSPSPNRFLVPHPNLPSSESTADAELNEDDIFTTDISESNDHHHHHRHNNNNYGKKTNISESFGILAAVPECPTSYRCCYHKASISSTHTIPNIPKPRQERLSFGKYQYQSAPVNVPMLARVMKKNNRWFDDMDEDDEADGDVVPPHEIVARTHSPVVASSVLEGVGRTLKGSDMRQVRNAIWRRLGYLD